MMKETTVTAKTIDEAVRQICIELDTPLEDIIIEVLEKPKKSMLGFKTSPAVVKGSIEAGKALEVSAFLEKLLGQMDLVDYALSVTETEEGLGGVFSITVPESDFLIGRKGEVLDALQYLVNLVTNEKRTDYFRVTLDCNGYRETRKAKLEELATRLSASVIKTKKPVTMEPMNPYERRIVHSAIQEIAGVTSSSMGAEPRRCVVIRLDPKN